MAIRLGITIHPIFARTLVPENKPGQKLRAALPDPSRASMDFFCGVISHCFRFTTATSSAANPLAELATPEAVGTLTRESSSLLAPGGTLVIVGITPGPASFDVVAAQAKEARIETVFRYANVYPKAVALLASGKVNLKPLLSANFSFEQGIAAFERAAEGRPADIKLQIVVEESV